jgi:two-component system, NtrC family, response regulator AtoC
MARILVAEDEEGIRSFLAEALEAEGHDVEQAVDGLDALDRLHERAFHLLITDLRMPRLDGLELVRRARAEQSEMEILVLTAHGSVTTAVEAMKLGVFDYLQKPIGSPAELRLVVSRALERRALRDRREEAERSSGDGLRLTWGDPAMRPVEEALRKVARTDATVLLLGESGTGKEVAARCVHVLSGRSAGPFAAVNCAALSEQLLESELFGHEKGAFTGAVARRRGRIELAEGGTFFLDEVAELKPDLQAKLLRVLQERRFERVGGTQTIAANVRWVAATNRDLPSMLRDGGFREDLYHRLAVFPVRLPPLRERPEDLMPLAESLLVRIGRELKRPTPVLSASARATIAARRWPGNVRELANALERAAILAEGRELRAEDLEALLPGDRAPGETSPGGSDAAPGGRTLADLERTAIERTLAEVGGNRRRAAEQLGIGLRTLYEKLRRFGIE